MTGFSQTRLEIVTGSLAVRAARRAFVRGTLAVVEAWVGGLEPSPGGAPVPLPIVRVEPRRRPDVRDLLRVHRLEGDGVAGARWRVAPAGHPDGWVAVLEVEVRRPARCAFALRFRFGDHGTVLRHAARGGRLGLAVDPPGGRGGRREAIPALVLPCPPGGIAEALAAHAALAGRGRASRTDQGTGA